MLETQEMQVQSPGWEDPIGGGNGNPLQYPCLENPMDRGPRWATVHEVAELEMIEYTCMCMQAHTHTHTLSHIIFYNQLYK